MTINKFAKIYIFAPANSTSGGPEALHQLSYYMNICNYNTNIVYYGDSTLLCPERYNKYEPRVILEEDVADVKGNIIIVPEAASWIINNYKNLTKCIWWLSVLFYDGHKLTTKIFMKGVLRRVKHFKIHMNDDFSKLCQARKKACKNLKEIYNFTGSQYAYDFLKKKKLNNIEMLVEPISKDFIGKMADNLTSKDRIDIIPYNPSKPSMIMKKLLERKDLEFRPIIGMTPEEIAKMFQYTKLYVDFGYFGGPERIPKEAVYNGTCLLVANHNAAANNFDIAIPVEYKIDNYNNEEYVVSKIKYVLNHYDDLIKDFEFFRNKIDKLEENFVEQIKTIFYVIN